MKIPCHDCYIRYNKDYTEECDTTCDYAAVIKENKRLKLLCEGKDYQMRTDADMAIFILDFIKRGYADKYKDSGVQKYIDALQMGIDAIKKDKGN